MNLVTCKCGKQFDLDGDSEDARASLRISLVICAKCEDEAWDRAEAEQERIEKQMRAELKQLIEAQKHCGGEDAYYELEMQIVELEASIEEFTELDLSTDEL